MKQSSFNDICSVYLKKYAFRPADEFNFDDSVGMIVTIPCYNEEHLITSLESLKKNTPTNEKVLVLVIVNGREKDSDKIKAINSLTIKEFNVWNKNNTDQWISFQMIEALDLPKKHAGVGLARKIVMDNASYYFQQINKDGVIICFDADSEVESNYLISIEEAFKDKEVGGASIHFEHPYQTMEYKDLKEGILQYELHLRYYVQGLKYAGYPFAFHTIGSSMVCRTSNYCKLAGMNKRKAGEDFYFLHKLIPNTKFVEIVNTKVIPSPRISDRVPFGTGRAQEQWVKENKEELQSYNHLIFKDLKNLMVWIRSLNKSSIESLSVGSLSVVIQEFFKGDDFINYLTEANKQTKNEASFEKRIWQYFDGFKILKLVHYMRDNQYPNTELLKGVNGLAELRGDGVSFTNYEEALKHFIQLDITIE